MRYKILCSDLDGTLLSTKSDVSTFTISEIKRIKEQLRIVLVSARMPKAMYYIQRDLGVLDQPIICYNGALIMNQGTILSSTEIPISTVASIEKMARSHGSGLGLYHKDEWYVPSDSERVQKEIRNTKSAPAYRGTKATLEDWKNRSLGAHKIMLMGTKLGTDTLFDQLEGEMGEQLHLYRSNDTLIEVAPKSVSKLSAIRQLLENQETLNDVIAFGDNYNDVEMLKKVGCGVAVANARQEAKAVADHVTLHNTEDGVAHFIKANL